jgi:archaetidylinositol phosphate synthase
MVLEALRTRFAAYVTRIARPFHYWSPASLSWIGLGWAGVAAFLSGLVHWTTPLLFLPVAAAIFLSGLFDVLDGEVARSTHRASKRGDFLDHVLDRYADIILVVGLAVSGYVYPILALFALASLLLTSYMGTQAQAVGQGRLYSGLLSRADRLIVLVVATFLEFDWSLPWWWAPSAPWAHFHWGGVEFTVIDVALVYFVIAGQWTAYARARRVYQALPRAP